MRMTRRDRARAQLGKPFASLRIPWACTLIFLIPIMRWTSAADSGNLQSSSGNAQTWKIQAVMPDHPAPPETYLCMQVDLPDVGALKLTGIEPLSHEALVHHMLLFGCSSRTEERGAWSCQGHGVCPSGGSQQVLYGWAKGAPAMHLPEGVGFKVGSGTKIDNLVLQIHYAVERPKGDVSGINLSLTNGPVPFSAGMMMFASSFQIPPKQERHLVPTRCCYSGFEPAHGFAFRVHTHALGRSVYLDEILTEEQQRRVVEHSPQLPQGFTPVTDTVFWPGQHLEATCQFNSTERDEVTWAGATHHHEMCNLYMITWSELPVFMNCFDSFTHVNYQGAGGIPASGLLLKEDPSVWQPLQSPEPQLQGHPAGPKLGQVAGVAKGLNGSVWVFHRADRVWDGATFSGQKLEHITHTEPIKEDTVYQVDQDTGKVLTSWGADTFFMPHMITVDRWGHVWLTDVGLHQVFKYDAAGKLLLTLGTKLKPGTGSSFCKPTHVAVSNNGTVYVSDGYCNSRVAQFSPKGEHQGDFTLQDGAMNTPHSVILQECSGTLVVADRENYKAHQFDLSSRAYKASWDLTKEGLVFGLASGPYGTTFAVAWDRDKKSDGQSKLLLLHGNPAHGVDQRWTLEGVETPHDLAVIAAPIRLSGSERPIAVLIGETRLTESHLHKFILMPSGTESLAAEEGGQMPSASEQWQAVLSSTLSSQQEIPPEIVAAKTADVHHSQTLTDEASKAEVHQEHSDWSTVQERGKDVGLVGGDAFENVKFEQGDRRWSRQAMLIGVPLLGFLGAITLAYKRGLVC